MQEDAASSAGSAAEPVDDDLEAICKKLRREHEALVDIFKPLMEATKMRTIEAINACVCDDKLFKQVLHELFKDSAASQLMQQLEACSFKSALEVRGARPRSPMPSSARDCGARGRWGSCARSGPARAREREREPPPPPPPPAS